MRENNMTTVKCYKGKKLFKVLPKKRKKNSLDSIL